MLHGFSVRLMTPYPSEAKYYLDKAFNNNAETSPTTITHRRDLSVIRSMPHDPAADCQLSQYTAPESSHFASVTLAIWFN